MNVIKSCSATGGIGLSLKSQKLVLDGDSYRFYDKRTGKLRLEGTLLSFAREGKKKWVLQTEENGVITVIQTGCGCGR